MEVSLVTWKGIKIEDMTRAQLIEALNQAAKTIRKQSDSYVRQNRRLRGVV